MPNQPRFLSFKEDFTRIVVQKEAIDGSVLIFPTDAAKQEALKIHRQNWKFEDVLFLSMNEMKSCLFLPEFPIIREEKRALLLYQALGETLKSQFYIQNYFQSIDLANKFFQFFEDLNEEMVNPDTLLKTLEEQDADLQDWQIETYDSLLLLRHSYADLLKSKGFADTIFTNRVENLQTSIIHKYNRFVFVNQFYYSNLESYINAFLEKNHKEVIVYYHMPETMLHEKDWKLDGIAEYRTDQIRLIKCCNHFGMLTSFFQMMEDHPEEYPELVLDPVFSKQPYARYLSAAKFSIPINDSFCRTTVFRFWEFSDNLLKAMIFEPMSKKYLIPLHCLSEVVFSGDLLAYFIPLVEDHAILRTEYDTLIKNDYQYIDLDLHFLEVRHYHELDPVTVSFFENLCSYVKQLLTIQSIRDFISLVNQDNGIPVKQILSETEKNSSNLEEVLYEALGNLQAIEELSIVTSWTSFFSASSTALTQGIIHLVLEFLKPKMIRYEHAHFEQKRVKISNLIDTRNLCYQHIAVFNANEGDLPGTTQVPWLFSETQRKLIGLKTYEDIRLREKYYFFRFLLSAESAWIFYISNEDEDKEASSFVEEIKLFIPSDRVVSKDWNDTGYKHAYSTLFPRTGEGLMDVPNRKISEDFFRLSFEPKFELEDGFYHLDYSHYSALRANPFASYLQYHAKLEEIDDKEENSLSEKMIGNITHEFYRICWDNVHQLARGEFVDFSFLEKFFTPVYLQSRMNLIMNKANDLYYRLPHNYSDLFFREVLWQQLTGSIESLVQSFQTIYGFEMIRPIPEQHRMTSEESQYKVLLERKEQEHGVGVKIRGKADLRVEEKCGKSLIIDYKTTQSEANLDRDQLLFYAYFYYNLKDQQVSEALNALFYMVFMQKVEDMDNKKNREKLYELFLTRLDQTISDLVERGFDLPTKAKGRDRFADITRIDLQRMLKGSLNVIE